MRIDRIDFDGPSVGREEVVRADRVRLGVLPEYAVEDVAHALFFRELSEGLHNFGTRRPDPEVVQACRKLTVYPRF